MPERRVIQVEFKHALRRSPGRGKSPSPFRFTTAEAQPIPQLHEILNRHGLSRARASFRPHAVSAAWIRLPRMEDTPN